MSSLLFDAVCLKAFSFDWTPKCMSTKNGDGFTLSVSHTLLGSLRFHLNVYKLIVIAHIALLNVHIKWWGVSMKCAMHDMLKFHKLDRIHTLPPSRRFFFCFTSIRDCWQFYLCVCVCVFIRSLKCKAFIAAGWCCHLMRSFFRFNWF